MGYSVQKDLVNSKMSPSYVALFHLVFWHCLVCIVYNHNLYIMIFYPVLRVINFFKSHFVE